MKRKNYTKKPMVLRSYRLSAAEEKLMLQVARREGISQSEFIRQAIRYRAFRLGESPHDESVSISGQSVQTSNDRTVMSPR